MTIRLAAQTQKTAGIPNGMRTATVAAVVGTKVTLSVSGGLISSGVGVLKSYSPVVGDTVAVFRQDASWLVLGKIDTSSVRAHAIVTGTVLLTFASNPVYTQAVSFGVTFATPPAMSTNIDTSIGTSVRWSSRAFDITTTGFNLTVYSTNAVAAAFTNMPVTWTAIERE